MRENQNQTNPAKGSKEQKDRHPRPENKDTFDSRKNEEQIIKADDITCKLAVDRLSLIVAHYQKRGT